MVLVEETNLLKHVQWTAAIGLIACVPQRIMLNYVMQNLNAVETLPAVSRRMLLFLHVVTTLEL